MEFLIFFGGFTLGGLFGVVLMCLLQVKHLHNTEYRADE